MWCGAEVSLLDWTVTPGDAGASMRNGVLLPGQTPARFNALDFFPDPSDEVGLWPKGVVPAIAGGGGLPGDMVRLGVS